MSLKTTLEALGNQVRRLSGKTNKMTLDAMIQALSRVNVGSNVSGADASITDVLNGKKFVGANGTLETGAMTNNGAVSKTLDTSTKTYNIPAGYHNGGGKVQIETQTKSVTPSASAQTVYPDSGKVLSAVTVAGVTSTGKQIYSGSTSGSGGSSMTFNMTVTAGSNDTFVMFAYVDSTMGSNSSNVVVSVTKNASGVNCTYAEPNADYDNGANIYFYKQTGASVSFSGTNVTVNSGHVYASFDYNVKYAWYLIKE